MRSSASRIDPLSRLTFLLAAGIAALFAAAPVVALWEETGRALVPWVSPGQFFHLALTHLQPDAQGLVRNPWYGTMVPAGEVMPLRFGLALRAFDVVRTAADGDASALVAWHAGLAVMIAGSLMWMLGFVVKSGSDGTPGRARDGRGEMPHRMLLLAAFAAIMWIDVRYAYADLLRFASTSSSAGSIGAGVVSGVGGEPLHGFPFSRLFFPQIGVPPLLIALACLLQWMPARRHPLLIGIVAVQLLVFMAFPQAAMVIVGSAMAIAVAGLLVRAIEVRDAGVLLIVAIVSLSLDVGASLLTAPTSDPRSTWALGVTQLRVDQATIVPLVLGAIALMLPSVERHVRAVLGGFAIGMGLMHAVEAGPHVESFYNLTFWLPLIAIALEIAARVPAAVARIVAGVAAAAFLAFAILEVRTATAVLQPINRANGELARALGMLDLTRDDVVVMPVRTEASWVPLVRPSTVLYSPGADLLLPRGSTEGAARLAAYRYLEGDDAGSPQASPIPPSLRGASRFVIADYKDHPLLKQDRIDRLFTVDRLVRTGAWRITIATPR